MPTTKIATRVAPRASLTATLAVALAVVLSGCKKKAPPSAAATDAPGPIVVWPGMNVSSASALPKARTAPWDNGSFLLKDGKLPEHKVRRIASCADLAGVAEDDVVIGHAWERYDFRGESIRCRVIAALIAAHPSRTGFVRDLVFADDPGGLLPAAVGPTPVPATSPARTWRAAEPTLTLDRDGARPDHHEVIAHGPFNGRLTWWAAADFDGDGIEDIVLFSNLTPSRTSAPSADTDAVMRAFVLTRRQAGDPVTILERFE